MEGNKLKGQVGVLLDDKYEDEKNRDKTFDDSRKACNLILKRMQKSSEDTAKEIEQAVARLIAVRFQVKFNFLKLTHDHSSKVKPVRTPSQ